VAGLLAIAVDVVTGGLDVSEAGVDEFHIISCFALSCDIAAILACSSLAASELEGLSQVVPVPQRLTLQLILTSCIIINK
jgi:hypothetical protein